MTGKGKIPAVHTEANTRSYSAEMLLLNAERKPKHRRDERCSNRRNKLKSDLSQRASSTSSFRIMFSGLAMANAPQKHENPRTKNPGEVDSISLSLPWWVLCLPCVCPCFTFTERLRLYRHGFSTAAVFLQNSVCLLLASSCFLPYHGKGKRTPKSRPGLFALPIYTLLLGKVLLIST